MDLLIGPLFSLKYNNLVSPKRAHHVPTVSTIIRSLAP
jgi:hypothetical protein